MSVHRMKLLIRADAGPRVGTGHVMRTLALGQSWQRLGGDVAFACGDLPNALIAKIQKQNFDVYKLNHSRCDESDAEETVEIAHAFQPNWLVLDGYQFGDHFQQAIRHASKLYDNHFKILVMDDYCHADHTHADLVVNQNAYAKNNLYPIAKSQPLKSPAILTGSRFVLLRKEFQRPPLEETTKPIAKEAKRILVTFGGADMDNWTLASLKSLSDLDHKKLIVDCVIGSCYSHLRELEKFKAATKISLRIHRNVEHMSILMERADLAISAGGSTCYELARCGVPTIAVPIAENQIALAREMQQRGVMTCVELAQMPLSQNGHDRISQKSTAPDSEFWLVADREKHSSDKPQNGDMDGGSKRHELLTQTIQNLVLDSEKRAKMSSQGMKLVDGHGGDRIAKKMTSMMYSFRVAQRADAELMLGWRNDPEVRSVSFRNDSIAISAHRKWLDQRLRDPATTIWISEDERGNPVGQIRLETSKDCSTAVVSIIVDQSLRGRGIGKTMIMRAAEEFFSKTTVRQIVAQIRPGNVASEKAFRTAGFTPIPPTIVNGKLANQFALQRDQHVQPRAIQKSA
ncbi:MAG: UDP-2,4-diacetamido-2,4,6-trideoxy-beta-L-altropyranose hydrolase [Mariniblastus sp.]|nr:UDP-2,4-diacetamido-2,4,6-trideoxy-beta-L-altropyranose hydrolase [Mariniblastus sp.]